MGGNLYYTPGQTVSFYTEVTDGYKLTDSPTIPVVTRILGPDFNNFQSTSENMVHVSTGLYYFTFTLPRTYTLGTYFVDIAYTDPNTNFLVNDSRQIIVSALKGHFRTTG